MRILFIWSVLNVISYVSCADDQIDSLLIKAADHYKNQEWDQSRDILIEIIHLTVHDNDYERLLQAYDQLGLVLEKQMAYDEAKENYLKALRVIKKYPSEMAAVFQNRLAVYYWRNKNYDSALFFAKTAQKHAEYYGQSELLADGICVQGLSYYSLGNYAWAIDAYKEALSIYDRVDSESNRASTHLNLGITYKKQALYDRAIKHLLKAASIYQDLNNRRVLASCYNSLASAYNLIGDHGLALKYHFQSLDVRNQLGDSLLIASSLNNIGEVYKNTKNLKKAIEYHLAALEIKRKLGDSSSIAASLNNLGKIYHQLEDSRAEEYLLKALDLAMKSDDQRTVSLVCNNLASYYIVSNFPEHAITYLKQARAIAIEMGTLETLRANYELTALLYEQTGDHSHALEFYKKHSVLGDSILSLAKQKALTEMQVRFETRQREKDIQTLNEKTIIQQQLVDQQKLLIYALLLGAALLLLVAFMAYWRYLSKNKANKHIRYLLRELHHRTKNNLQVISSMLSLQARQLKDKEAKAAASENCGRLRVMGVIHERLYQYENLSAINMQDYIESLLKDLTEGYGYSDDLLKVDLEIEDIFLEADTAIPLGLIINELVSNAFKHVFNRKRNNRLFIALNKVDNTLELIVSDNGSGFQSDLQTKQSDGFGLQLIQALSSNLRGTINICNENGTRVELRMKQYKLARPDKVLN